MAEINEMTAERFSLSLPYRYHRLKQRERAAGENYMHHKAAARTSKKKTSVEPLFFSLWWLQAVLGSLLSHSSSQLMRRGGLKVNASSHFIPGASQWQNISLSFFQACHASWSNFCSHPPSGLYVADEALVQASGFSLFETRLNVKPCLVMAS